MNRSRLFVVFLISIFTINLQAQIDLRLPKLTRPGSDAPVKARSSGSSASAKSNRQLVIDDGFTFFDAEPLQEYSAEARRQVGIGWHLRPYLRMFGTVPNRSGFNVVVNKNGKALTKIRCEGEAYRKAEDPVPQKRTVPEDDYLITNVNGCQDKTKVIKETGKLDVQVFYFNGETDEEKLLRTYKIDVREASRVRGVATAPVTDVPHYYIQRHAETAASILYLRPRGYPNYYRARGDNDYIGEVEIYFNISPKRQVDRVAHGNLRCTVNGTPLRFPGPSPFSDQIDVKSMRNETAIYTDRIAPQYKKANEYMDEVSFNQYRLRLPLLLRGDPASNRLGLQDHKGNWDCSFRINGETVRNFKWTVGSNGLPVAHGEQQAGNIALNYNGYLIETVIPNGGSTYDHRLIAAPNDGLFYGINWTTPDGRAMAAAVPSKGKPYHVSSDKAGK